MHDTDLQPLFFGLIGFTLWMLYRSSRHHALMTPFWVGLAGGGTAVVGLFLHPWVVWMGLGTLLAGCVWGAWNGRSGKACATDPNAPSPAKK